MKIKDIKKSIEIITFNAEFNKLIISDDVGLDRGIKEYDKFIFVGYLQNETVEIDEDKLDPYKIFLTLNRNGGVLEIFYIAKSRPYANNLGKIVKNCVNTLEKVGYVLKGLDLKYMEIVFETLGYKDLEIALRNLCRSRLLPYNFHYRDEKNRYWRHGNGEAFVRKGLYDGIKNFEVRYDPHFIIHGYISKDGTTRLEMKNTKIDFRIFPVFDEMKSN